MLAFMASSVVITTYNHISSYSRREWTSHRWPWVAFPRLDTRHSSPKPFRQMLSVLYRRGKEDSAIGKHVIGLGS